MRTFRSKLIAVLAVGIVAVIDSLMKPHQLLDSDARRCI